MEHLPLDVQPILTEFYNELKGIFPGFVTGLYVTGSVVLDDFHAYKSDIDFVVVCENPDQYNLQSTLSRIHNSIQEKFKIATLNGVYLTTGNLDLQESQRSKIFRYQDGRVEKVFFEMAPIVLYELKATGVGIMGKAICDLPIRVEINEVNDFLYQNINTYWRQWVDNHSALLRKKFLLILFPRLTEWGVLGVARQYYTLKTGRVASKTGAGKYCLGVMSKESHAILDEAIHIRIDKHIHSFNLRKSYYLRPSMKRANETLACMDEIITLFNEDFNRMSGSDV